jgi:hypothetical protein
VPSSNASMEARCRRPARIGLPALAITEHLDVGVAEAVRSYNPTEVRTIGLFMDAHVKDLTRTCTS